MIRARAPLRLGLAGGGTDVSPFCDIYGGYILNVTIDKYAYANIETNEDNKIRFVAADLEEIFECELTDSIPPDEKLSLHKGVYNRIIKDFNNGNPLSLTMTTFADAPPGSGLGSSSTIVIAMLQAYAEMLNLPFGEYELAHLAYEIERIDLGLKGGKQDQYAAAFGGFNFMEFYSNDRVIVNPLRIKNNIIAELETSLVLFETKVSRNSADIISEQEKNVNHQDQVVIESFKELKENALKMKEFILKGELKQFAEFLDKSWESKKKTAHNISSSNINKIYELAKDAGAISGKVSGAGGGGFIFFLVDPAKRMNVIKALEAVDGRAMSCHFTNHGTTSWKTY